ncbi:MAG: PhzF family phenazine biosynthesis protein [Alphaproteobacteria bacterium]
MTTYEFKTCDVFTDQKFGGNQLAVFLNAEGISSEDMQKLANEIGYAETTFVLPPTDPKNTAKVRIFTPTYEMPFAGHPNVGTAYMLAIEAQKNGLKPTAMVFEEIAGLVDIEITWDGDKIENAMLTAPKGLEIQCDLPIEIAAPAAGVSVHDLKSGLTPVEATTGASFAFVELQTYEALKNAKPVTEAHSSFTHSHGLLAYFKCEDDAYDVRTRMFGPNVGIAEDSATGSANITLAGLLVLEESEQTGVFIYRIAQGIEMGRPSLLIAEATKQDGKVTKLRIGGKSVPMFEAKVNL